MVVNLGIDCSTRRGCSAPSSAMPAYSTVLALNLVGEGLNDALNPRLRDR